MQDKNSDSIGSDSTLDPGTLTRRQFLALAASASAGLALASCAPALTPTPTTAPPTAVPPTIAPTAVPPTATVAALPPPETTAIRIACGGCDTSLMAAERFLREEGFTDVQISDTSALAGFSSGKVDIGSLMPQTLASAIQDGMKVVGIAGLHPGCVEIWAQPSIASIKDLRSKTIVVPSKALGTLAYSHTAIVLKQSGVDLKDVNFVVQADANLVNLYLDDKNDAVLVTGPAAVALKANPANKGHLIYSQVMDDPWAHLNCCNLVTTQDWLRANPIAAKRALRAIFRTADSLPADRADAAKLATDKGLFGGAKNFDNVRTAVNMLPVDWRGSDTDMEKMIRFYAPLLADVGLLKLSADDLVKALDVRILRELDAELKKKS